MNLQLLIFSDQVMYRILRHIFFWLVWFFFLFANSNGLWHSISLMESVQHDLLGSVNRILPQILFCYFIIYLLVPKFFMRRDVAAGIVLLIMSFPVFYYLQYFSLMLLDPFEIMGLESNLRATHSFWDYESVSLAQFTYHSGPFVCCGVMGSMKFLKFWYVKQQENVALRRENAIAELQLLKAQVHPHLLFNTLNNIYSFTLTQSPLAGDLIEKLSGILRYMILEGQNTLVPLKNEIRLIRDYIDLEKVRYGDRIDINVSVKGNAEGKFIAPLLMIPFVENTFKHGSSKVLNHPTVSLSIVVEGNQLSFVLKNNKPDTNRGEAQSNCKGGIGLENTAKRLQLLYPDKHDVKIETTNTAFHVGICILY